MGNILNRKSLLAKEKLVIEEVELEGGDSVFIRQMTGRERDRFEQSLVTTIKNVKGVTESKPALDDFRAKLIVCVACDEKGKLLLLPGDVEVLSQNMSAFTLEKLVNVAQRLNKISQEDKEELSKNSEAVQKDNSTSASVKN